jgi:hypothetical protein
VWRNVTGADRHERRSYLSAPRVPTVGIDIGGTKVMAGVVDADGGIPRTTALPPSQMRPGPGARPPADGLMRHNRRR